MKRATRMTRSSRLAMLLALACAGAGAVTWAALRAPRASTALVEATPARAEETEDGDATRTSSALERAERAEGEEPVAARAAPQSRTSAAAEEAELADAIWIEGRVLFPAGTPADERAEVVARGRAYGSRGPDRAEVARDGSFKVAFHPKAKRAHLVLDARYLYLASSYKIDLRAHPEDVVLEPELGGRIEGVLLPPQGLRPGEPMPEAVRISLMNGELAALTTDAERGERGYVFELAGVRAGSAYTLEARPDGWWRRLEHELEPVAAGELRTVELQLEPGVRVGGRVVDGSGRAMQHARVTATRGGMSASHSSEQRTTDADGAFHIGGLAPGKIDVEAHLPGYLPARAELGEVADGDLRGGLELVLVRGHTVAGRVTWPDGSPADGAVVLVEELELGSRREHRVRLAPEGSFEITGLGSGPYRVTATAERDPDGGRSGSGSDEERWIAQADSGGDRSESHRDEQRWIAQADDVAPDSSGLVLVLEAGASIRGRVVDEGGAPLDEFTITLHLSGETRLGQPGDKGEGRRFKAAGGAFELRGLEPGDWFVAADARGHGRSPSVRVTLPRDTEPIELTVTAGATIRGTVLEPDGGPAARAEVSARGSQYLSTGWMRTRSDGSFTLEGVTGAVVVSARKQGSAGAETGVLELLPGEQRDVVLQLLLGGRIEGSIEGPGRRDGQAVSLQATGSRRTAPGGSQQIMSGADGSFIFEDVPPGVCRVRLVGADASGSSAEVEVHAGAVARVVLGVPRAGAIRVLGTVTRGGVGLAGARVIAAKGDVRSQATTDSGGAYELSVDVPGEYLFLVHGETFSHNEHRAQIAGPEQRVDIRLPASAIRGRVVKPDGKGAGGVEVVAGWEGGNARATSAVDGAFELLGLPAGTVMLRAQMPGSPFAPVQREVELAEDALLEGVELRLSRAGTIEGRVTTAGGDAVVGAWIRLSPPDASGGASGTQTDGAGRFKVGALAAGTWSVWTLQGTLVSEPRTVDVRADETLQVDLVLSAGTLVQVVVENADGWYEASMTGASGITYSAHARDPGQRALGGEPASGARIGPLPPGEYRLEAWDRAGRRRERSVTVKGEPVIDLRLALE